MKIQLILLGLCSLMLHACDNNKAESQSKAEDNPMLKLQNDTTNKAQNAVNQATQEQNKQLEEIGQ